MKIIIVVFISMAMAVSSYAQDQRTPCSAPGFSEFDFWLGEWEVYNTAGKLAGYNRIEKILGNCALLENWTGAGGGSGKSLNSYNEQTGEWRQTWVDSQGITLYFKGKYAGGKMEMRGGHETPEGKMLYRLTFYNNQDGTVRQHWESSKDGRDWNTVFDGLYKKVKE